MSRAFSAFFWRSLLKRTKIFGCRPETLLRDSHSPGPRGMLPAWLIMDNDGGPQRQQPVLRRHHRHRHVGRALRVGGLGAGLAGGRPGPGGPASLGSEALPID